MSGYTVKGTSPVGTELATSRLSRLCVDLEQNSADFQKELKYLLQKKHFLQVGGIIGFGLGYKYNWSETDGYITNSGIDGLYNMLKPTDKLLYSIGLTFGLRPKLKIIYNFESYPGVSLLSTNLSPFPGGLYSYEPAWKNTNGLTTLCEKISGEFIELSKDWASDGPGIEVNWVKTIEYVNNRLEYIEQVAGKKGISSVSRSYVLVMSVPRWAERQGVGK